MTNQGNALDAQRVARVNAATAALETAMRAAEAAAEALIDAVEGVGGMNDLAYLDGVAQNAAALALTALGRHCPECMTRIDAGACLVCGFSYSA